MTASVALPTSFGTDDIWWASLKSRADGFFFQLRSAFDCVLQEVNVLAETNLPVTRLFWDNGTRKAGLTATLLSKPAYAALARRLLHTQDLHWWGQWTEFRNQASDRHLLPHSESVSWGGSENPSPAGVRHPPDVQLIGLNMDPPVVLPIQDIYLHFVASAVDAVQQIWHECS